MFNPNKPKGGDSHSFADQPDPKNRRENPYNHDLASKLQTMRAQIALDLENGIERPMKTIYQVEYLLPPSEQE